MFKQIFPVQTTADKLKTFLQIKDFLACTSPFLKIRRNRVNIKPVKLLYHISSNKSWG